MVDPRPSSVVRDVQLHDLMFEYPSDVRSLQARLPTYREFNDLRLEPTEEPIPGLPFKHQKFLAMVMRIQNSILLMDATGTGKTGAFGGASEMFRDHPEYGIHKAFFITKNVQLTEWMKESLVSVTNPLGYSVFNKPGASINQMGRKKKLTQFLSSVGTLSSGDVRVKPYKMQFSTYASFVNRYQGVQNRDLIKMFSGSLIIIDEVHRILPKYLSQRAIESYADRRISREFVIGEFKFGDARSIDDEYLFVHWLVQHVKRMKKIYSSATPIINQLSRLQALANILRTDTQFYESKSVWDSIGDDPQSKIFLKEIFGGYIAYTREFDNNIVFKDYGEPITVDGDTFIMDSMEMVRDGPQEYAYKNSKCQLRTSETAAAIEDAVEAAMSPGVSGVSAQVETSGLCIDQRQASMFVYPDGAIDDSTGRWTGIDEKTFVHISEKSERAKASAKKLKIHVAKQGLRDRLADMSTLKGLSVRFWNIMKSLHDENEGRISGMIASRSWFEYMIYVNNSIDILGMTLSAHGYKRFYMREGARDHAFDYMRFAIVTAKTDPAERTAILRMMNVADNYDGKVIRIFIGSSTVIEGISVRNVTKFGTDAQWTDGEEYQSMSRVKRATSHVDLDAMIKRSDPVLNALVDSRGNHGTTEGYQMLMARHGRSDKIEIEAHFYNSYPSGMSSNRTIESRVRASSRRIGKKVGVINRVFKEIAINCNLNRRRNIHVDDVPGTRDCDFMSCNYKCDDPVTEEESGLDVSNYRILRMAETVDELLERISVFFSGKSSYRLTEIENSLSQQDREFLPHAIERIVTTNVSTTNRFGEAGYMRIIGDVIYFSKDYARHDWLASPWSSNSLNIRECLDTEAWIFRETGARKGIEMKQWIEGSDGETFPKAAMNDLSVETLSVYFELLVDKYYRSLDRIRGSETGTHEQLTRREHIKYLYAMKRLSYHYAATTKNLEPLFNEMFGLETKGTPFDRDERHVRYLFHVLGVFNIKGSIRYVSGENDVENMFNNLRIYDRRRHKWIITSDYAFNFVSVVRRKRDQAMKKYVLLSPFVRVVIPDDVIKVVGKKGKKERRKLHGVVCKNDSSLIGLFRAFGYNGTGDCNTLLEAAKDVGRAIYT